MSCSFTLFSESLASGDIPALADSPTQVGLLKHFPNKGNPNSLRGILIAAVKRIKCSSSNPPNNKVTKVEGDLFSFKK